MKQFLGLFILSLFFAVPMLTAQERSDLNHGEVGVFADYYRYTNAHPTANFIGIGGRAGFNVHPNVQLEAEMAYDFKRNYTSTFTNGITSTTVNTSFRALHGLFGPKFQVGTGAFRVFVTGKVGFTNFTLSNNNAGTAFLNTVGLSSGLTAFAVYPAAGFEAFAGPIGIRAEAGDDVFFHGGAHNNLRVTFGPQFRF
jgi:hypothetical protein